MSTPSAGWTPMPDPAAGGVTSPPFLANLTAEERTHLPHRGHGRADGHLQQADPDGKGGTIAPTGKAFAVDMITVGIWNRQGTMDEEFLFWDNQTFYGEMGVG
jgi:hypothetical protein